MRMIDISRPLRCGEEIDCRIPEELPLYEGYECEEYRFRFSSHRGCYYETSAHLFRDGTRTSDVSVEEFFLPAVVARLDPSGEESIGSEEVSAAIGGELRPGDGLIVDTRGNRERYFTREFGAWLAHKDVALLAATLERYDTGLSDPTGVFVELFKNEIPIIAEIRNLERVSHERVFLVALPVRIEGVCNAPARAVVLDGETDEIESLVRLLRPDLAGKG